MTLPLALKGGRMRTLGEYLAAVVLCLGIAFWAMKLRAADLHVPIMAPPREDAMCVAMWVKCTVENGWFLENPFVGAPHPLLMYEFPQAPNLHMLLMKTMGMVIPDYAAVMNLYFLLSFPLTAISALFVLRHFGISFLPALVGSLLYTFLPFHILRYHHLFLACYYLVPLMVMVVLWVYLGRVALFTRAGKAEGVARPRAVFAASIIICVLMGCEGAYYAFFGCFFLAVAGIAAAVARRKAFPLLSAAVLAGVIVVAALANLSPSLIYRWRYGLNPLGSPRAPADSETYGLKIAQLLQPMPGHRFGRLNRWRVEYDTHAPLVNENGSSSLGAVGSVGFLLLIGWMVFRPNRPAKESPAPADVPATGPPGAELIAPLGVLNLSAVLLATIGGISSIIAFAGFWQIRAYNRISVYIAFLCLLAVCLLLNAAARRWKRLAPVLLGAVLVVGILDQTSPRILPDYEAAREEFLSDRDFVRKIEQTVPPGTAIYQFPYVQFPGELPIHRMHDYSLLRGYLHSRTLRWSYGTIRGREGDAWQQHLAAKPLNELVEILPAAGYGGIYIDRFAYADSAADMEKKLAALLDEKPLVSPNGRLSFFDLGRFAERLRQRCSGEEWSARQWAAFPVLATFGPGFGHPDPTLPGNSRWCTYEGQVHLFNPGRRERSARLEMSLRAGHAQTASLVIDCPLFRTEAAIGEEPLPFSQTVTVPPGRHIIAVRSNALKLGLTVAPDKVFCVIELRVVNLP